MDSPDADLPHPSPRSASWRVAATWVVACALWWAGAARAASGDGHDPHRAAGTPPAVSIPSRAAARPTSDKALVQLQRPDGAASGDAVARLPKSTAPSIQRLERHEIPGRTEPRPESHSDLHPDGFRSGDGRHRAAPAAFRDPLPSRIGLTWNYVSRAPPAPAKG